MCKIECSICIATHNKADILNAVLASIMSQNISFDFEIIVVDDNSNDKTIDVCLKHEGCVIYKQLIHTQSYRNPAIARNTAYKMARGHVVICQSDDVIHITPDSVEQLVLNLLPDTFTIATVFNTDINGNIVQHPLPMLTGIQCQRPLFFLGSILRSDLYRAGGNDELYISPGFEDNAFADSLIAGLGLKVRYDAKVVGHHIDHPRPKNLSYLVTPSRIRYQQRQHLCTTGQESWLSGYAWEYND